MASRLSISEEWYAHLEQGHTDAVSAQVYRGLANLYGLSPVEIEYLFTLAAKPMPWGIRPEDTAVPEVLRRFVDAQSPCPGYVIDHHWDALAWNDGAQAVLYDLASQPRRRRNLLIQDFTNPAFRRNLASWEAHARIMLAFFRLDYGRNLSDPRIRQVVAELRERSEEFRWWWPLQEVGDHVCVRFVYALPGHAALHFDRLTSVPGGNPNLRIVIFQPVPNTGTEQEVTRLIAEHRGRRAANGGR